MGMLAISKKGEITMSLKKDINLNGFFKSDQLVNVTTEESTNLKRRKVGNLKLQTTFSLIFSPKSSSELEEAVIKMQKFYKSYRTRRILADYAVICEELWWKDSVITAFDECSISHFDSDKSETPIPKWENARMMAAEVGKGLSKDDKAQKLALRHWLEAIDPRHRYGHNLHFYYEVWFHSQSNQPFFYWLDVGEGKKTDLDDLCPRGQLQSQRINYLGPEKREAYEVIVEAGRLVYRQTKKRVHTTEESKWIFVLSLSRILYVGQKKKGQFQHSSFLSGGATIASGRLVAHDGVLHAIWPYSGHYRPTEKNFLEFICFLEEHNVDITNVKKNPVDDDVPPSRPINEELIEGSEGSNDSTIINNHSQENVGQFGTNVEASLEENKPMSSNWSTGVGPRIACVKGYPLRIQLQALEQLNSSPRVNHGTIADKTPIPSPRPRIVHLSPRLLNMGLPSPRVHVWCFFSLRSMHIGIVLVLAFKFGPLA